MVESCEKGRNWLRTRRLKLWEQHLRLMDTWDLGCIIMVPPEELGTPTTEETTVKKHQKDATATATDPWFSLSLSPLDPFFPHSPYGPFPLPSYFFLFLYLTFTVK